MAIKKNIILKISGASLKGEDGIISSKKIDDLANQIKQITKKYNIGIIVGGGNIWRGNSSDKKLYNRVASDYMGMLGTIINSIALKEILLKKNVPTCLYSLLDVPKVADVYKINKVNQKLAKNYVCIFAAGTGNPFVSTDTAAAMRACEINADLILMAKDGVDGVYDKDPKKFPNAKRFSSLSYEQVVEKNLKVMDETAISICKEYKIQLLVFNNSRPNAIVKALAKTIPTTIIK